MYQPTKLNQHYLFFLNQVQDIKRSIFTFIFCLPTSLFALLLLFLLLHNGFSVFYIHLPFPATSYEEPTIFQQENLAGKSLKKITSLAMHALKEETPSVVSSAHLPSRGKEKEFHVFSFRKRGGNLVDDKSTNTTVSLVPFRHSLALRPRKLRVRKLVSKVLGFGLKSKRFSRRLREFYESYGCKVRFFMTWISSLGSFGDRELFAIESLFKSHPNACLVIISNSMDSNQGRLVLKPFLDKGFRLISVKPDFDYLFKNTPAESWFNKLKKGNVDPGEVSLGQNLSNLLRLALLYKFGGTYLDTDVIVLKSFGKLRNVIGAQTIDLETGNWSRLNNAVLIFDKNHPILFKFIQEFALTFDGNKWGHNGPYLVSRVVSRIIGRPQFGNITILPPSAFYPVSWSRIETLFKGPRGGLHSKWLIKKLEQIKEESFAVHLWNKRSRSLRIENGSIIGHIMGDHCIFCNSNSYSL